MWSLSPVHVWTQRSHVGVVLSHGVLTVEEALLSTMFCNVTSVRFWVSPHKLWDVLLNALISGHSFPSSIQELLKEHWTGWNHVNKATSYKSHFDYKYMGPLSLHCSESNASSTHIMYCNLRIMFLPSLLYIQNRYFYKTLKKTWTGTNKNTHFSGKSVIFWAIWIKNNNSRPDFWKSLWLHWNFSCTTFRSLRANARGSH